MGSNKVSVKIYGQEYVIAGAMSREEIVQCAANVDLKMHEIAEAARSAGASPQNVAILAAVNITSEQLSLKKEMDEVRRLNAQLEKDAQHYVQLWDESKKSYSDYKEETQAIVLHKDELLVQLKEKDEEIAKLYGAVAEAQAKSETAANETQAVAAQINELSVVIREKDLEISRLQNEIIEVQNQSNPNLQNELNEAQKKYKEVEASFYDLHMENLQLKKELEKYKNSIGQF